MFDLKKVRVAVLAGLYAFTGLSPAFADDSEIYLGGVSSATSGNPNVLLLIDTSGSMAWSMTANESTSTTSNQRMTHLKAAVEKILTTLPGNIRVGVSRYNSDGNGGRIIYPLTSLDTPAGANADGSLNFSSAIAAKADDVEQGLLADSSTLITDGATLTIGGGIPVSYTIAASADGAVECNDVNTPAILVGGAGSGITKGLYLNNHPTLNGSTYCESSLGLRFLTTIPAGSAVSSARLVFTHAGSDTAAPSGSTWGKTSNDQLGVRVHVQNVNGTATTLPEVYSSTAGIKARSYVAGVTATATIAEDTFMTEGALQEIDVTNLVRNRVTAAGASPLQGLAFRVEGLSGNGTYSTETECRKWKKGKCTEWRTVTTDSPKIRRIYGRHDDAAKAPRLVITYASTGALGRNVGVRFQGLSIPQGSTIDEAYVEMTAASDSAGSNAVIQVVSDSTSPTYINSLPFDSVNHLGQSARWNASSYTSTQAAWERNKAYKIDVKSALQGQVNHSAFCGGALNAGNQAVGFRFQLDSGSSRMAYSWDGDAERAPRLVVRYTPPTGTTCIQNARASSSGSTNSNYAVQSGTGNNALGGNNSERTRIQLHRATVSSTACADDCAVLRFPAIDIPRDAEITGASLKLVSSNSTAGTVTLKGVNTGDVAAFTTTAKISSMLLYSEAASWAVPANNAGKNLETSGTTATDFKVIIQKIVQHPSWVRGNALGIVLGNNADKGPQFYTTEKTSAHPQLTITYKSIDARDGISTARQDIIKVVKALPANGGTPLNETYYESALYMLGETAKYGRANTPALYDAQPYADAKQAMTAGNLYQSPVGEASCQSNNIVLLTDGLPSSDFDQVSKGSCSKPANLGTIGGNQNTSGSFQCMAATADYLASTGRSANAKIKTYTIGFGPVASISLASEGLADVAAAGQGEYFAATDADSLATTFQTIFARVADSNGTMAAPGVAVNQLNRSEHLDQLYYGVFKPRAQKRWPGNIKRYRLSDDNTVVGRNGANAISADTKYFSESAVSWWTSGVDGNEAALGGAAEKQASELTVYTENGSSVYPLNGKGAADLPAALGATDAAKLSNAKWLMGYDVDNEMGVGANGFRKSMGAPIHPQPALMSYGSGDEDFVVFISTNDGLLHSINVNNGSHNWAWIPEALLGNVAALRANEGMGFTDAPIYGLDGSWTPVKLADGTRLLVGGMRQGGTNVYALKLGESKSSAPTLQWMLTPASTGFSRLAHTWSQPVLTRVRHNGDVKEVFVFGAGLDKGLYEGGAAVTSSGTDSGNGIYIVDAKTGALLGSASHSAMKYSIPGMIRAIDKDGDGFTDHLYAGDTGGQVFRMDLDNRRKDASGKKKVTLLKRTVLLAKLGISADTGKANDRRFYETPAIALMKDSGGIHAAIAIGSGDRSFPKSNRDTVDRFYMIRDYDIARSDLLTSSANFDKAFTHANLSDVTSATSTVDATKKGWYFGFPAAAEKVLSSPFVFSRQTPDGLVFEAYFNTFRPDSSAASSCAPVAGSTAAWTVLMRNGRAGRDLNNDGVINDADRYIDNVAAGITGSDVGVIRDTDGDGVGDQYKRITGTNIEDAGKVPAGFNQIQRTRWYDVPAR